MSALICELIFSYLILAAKVVLKYCLVHHFDSETLVKKRKVSIGYFSVPIDLLIHIMISIFITVYLIKVYLRLSVHIRHTHAIHILHTYT